MNAVRDARCIVIPHYCRWSICLLHDQSSQSTSNIGLFFSEFDNITHTGIWPYDLFVLQFEKKRTTKYIQNFIVYYPSAFRAGGVLSSRSGRAGGCQICRTHISVTAGWIFTVQSSVELSRPVVVHCHGHLPICPIWACPWAKNLSNLAQIGSRLCGTHISETIGWIDPHLKFHGLVWTCSCATS